MMNMFKRKLTWLCTASVVLFGTAIVGAQAPPTPPKPKPAFPPHGQVLAGYEKVVSTADASRSLYTLWVNKKEGQVLAELPPNYATAKYFIALTIASGDRFAGLQSGDMFVYWRRYNKRLALIKPDLGVRSTGDPESLSSVRRLFTDTILLDMPIMTLGPSGGPVIDLDMLLVGKASKFFGSSVVNREFSSLFSLKQVKAFPNNVEVAFEVPTSRGKLQTLHYSISEIPTKSTYKPRKADQRIGYFTTSYSDYGKYTDEETRVRYINRWHLEKRDSSLKVSPPKNPIVFYIEHTTPVRYRRWVREGVLAWNDAFEKVGISSAIEVYYQDKQTGAHMDKDPEDVRYNFVRWLNNDIGTAIGPSRVNPLTGEILDADIVLTDGWIRHFRFEFEKLLPKIAMDGFDAETMAWLASHPSWDPRIRLAPVAQREYLKQQMREQGHLPYGGDPLTRVHTPLLGDEQYDGLVGRTSQVNGMCLAAEGMALDVAIMRMNHAIGKLNADEEKKDDKAAEEKKEEKEDPKKEETIIDGMPESFIGPLLAHLVAHEVGHTIGLRHNFKGTSIYSYEKINGEELKGKQPWSGSVMDYAPTNIRSEAAKGQGDFTMLGIGPYDFWAIEYGYTQASDLKPILDRVSEPELQFATDEDTSGPDPLARRYDLGANPLAYAQDQLALVNYHRGQILDKFVKDGDSWAKARYGYELTLSMQMRAVSMMGNWIGGVHVRRDKKGDKNNRSPLEVVSAKEQRDALNFVVQNTFEDKAFGLTAALLQKMTVDKWLDGSHGSRMSGEAAWPIHDRIMGLQASALTMIMNPTTLRRVYDNEFRIPEDQDALTLPELLDSLTKTIWSELDAELQKQHTARQPAISSLRRNLQREHLKRLIDLSMPGAGNNEAFKPISNLSLSHLRAAKTRIEEYLKKAGDKLDPYSRAHLSEVEQQISKALDAQYIYNANKIGGRSSGATRIIIGTEQDE